MITFQSLLFSMIVLLWIDVCRSTGRGYPVRVNWRHRQRHPQSHATETMDGRAGSIFSSCSLGASCSLGESNKGRHRYDCHVWGPGVMSIHLPKITSDLQPIDLQIKIARTDFSYHGSFLFYESPHAREIVLCNSQPSSVGSEGSNYKNTGEGGTNPGANVDEDGFGESAVIPPTELPSGSPRERPPLVYRYYGRSRPRGHSENSVPFILFGPNVDHWKTVGQILASRGFSVMACERLAGDDSIKNGQQHSRSNYTDHEGANLIVDIIDALRWNRVVLVGCDEEAKMVIESAMLLAPERVAGLVLCGDLTDAEELASEFGVEVLDIFLGNMLKCPFTIVDGGSQTSGDGPTVSVSSDSQPYALSRNRCIILGGGSAPHRKQPEQFTWVLTRFVEEKVISMGAKSRHVRDEVRRIFQDINSHDGDQNPFNLWRRIVLPFGLDNVASSEGRLLLGRAIATAVFYIAMMRVAIVQYGLLRSGLKTIKSRYDSFDALRRKVFQSIGAFFVNFGYIPRLFSLKRATDEYDDDGLTRIAPKSSKTPSDSVDNDIVNESPAEERKDVSGKDDDQNGSEDDDGDQGEQPSENDERGRFQPFFFLDHVVT